MTTPNWRISAWDSLDQAWDLIVVGGGITGAAVFRRAVSAGLKTLLIEKSDFSSGTSSKSSKLVHGGFRYLRNRQWDITFESVREREWLLKQAPNLVDPMPFILPYTAKRGQKRKFAFGVVIYDLMGSKWQHKRLDQPALNAQMPSLQPEGMLGAYQYYDAVLDDSVMVTRLINESVEDGGLALNYAAAEILLKDKAGKVRGLVVKDTSGEGLGDKEVRAKVVVNATGPWSDTLRGQAGAQPRMRPLRGSHLVFSQERLPITSAVTIMQPQDGRAMFAIPWENNTIVGTTDLDHTIPLEEREPYCTQAEHDYILHAANHFFPSLALEPGDVISSFAGVRPIIKGDASDPSKESRKHMVWDDQGLITIAGGKLTIFRVMAEDVMRAIQPYFEHPLTSTQDWFKPLRYSELAATLEGNQLLYLAGRYGQATDPLITAAQPGEHERIGPLMNTWAELRHAAATGKILRLEDLLLRRVRLGLLLPDGAEAYMPRIRDIVQPTLGWDDARWDAEYRHYRQVWLQAYSPAPQD